MIGLFKQKSPGNIIVLLIFALLIKLPLFLFPRNTVVTDADGPLYSLLINALPQQNDFISGLLSLLLLYGQALMVTYLTNEYRLLPRHNYLPGMAYLLITSLMPEWSYLSSPLVAATFVIWIFSRLFSVYNLQNARPQVYNLGLLAGISSYIYFPSGFFALCALLGLMILKPFRLNEIVLFLLGCITPYYFYGVVLFLSDRLSFETFLPKVQFLVPFMKSSIPLAAATLLLALPFLVGGFHVQKHMRKMLIQVRKNWSIILLYLVLAFLVPFVNSNSSFHAWVLLAAPFAVFHSSGYFYIHKPFIPLFLFFSTLGYILYMQFGTTLWH